jgi:hypothetical protein
MSSVDNTVQQSIDSLEQRVSASLEAQKKGWSLLVRESLQEWVRKNNTFRFAGMQRPSLKLWWGSAVTLIAAGVSTVLVGADTIGACLMFIALIVCVQLLSLLNKQTEYDMHKPHYRTPSLEAVHAEVQVDVDHADGVLVLQQGNQEMLRLPLTGLSIEEKASLLLRVKTMTSSFNEEEKQRRQTALDKMEVGSPEAIASKIAAFQEQHRQALLLNSLDAESYEVINREVEDIRNGLVAREQTGSVSASA